MTIINCPYYLINNESDLQKAKELYKFKQIYDIPFIIGNEKGFVFQVDINSKMKDFQDKETNELYKYNLQVL